MWVVETNFEIQIPTANIFIRKKEQFFQSKYPYIYIYMTLVKPFKKFSDSVGN